MNPFPVHGILLLYHHYLFQNAPTIMDHVTAFGRHSRFKMWSLNTEFGFPDELNRMQFDVIVLHYSLFGPFYLLNEKFLKYLDASKSSYKIAIFQDEYRYCQQRFRFINRFKIDCVYTLLEPAFFKDVYGRYTRVSKILYTLPGFVSDDLVRVAAAATKPVTERTVDVGYRARQLSFYMGKGAQEKHQIGFEFKKHMTGSGFRLDIETEEERRIYGRQWYQFLADCRAVLGVEAGVSIFDLDDEVRRVCDALIRSDPGIGFEEVSKKVLEPWEGNIPYRTISPRHFEAAAFRVLQILFEGSYSGLMKPMVHYIPLRKDFSNIDEVLHLLKDEVLCSRIVDTAYNDLVGSGKYSYEKFIEGFDRELLAEGYTHEISEDGVNQVNMLMDRGKKVRQLRARLGSIRHYRFPGRAALLLMARPGLKVYRRLARRRGLDSEFSGR
jgi:hypothetical protein